MENLDTKTIEAQGRRPSLETIRPWRKRTLQIISTEKWRKESEVTPLPQVAGHGSWDKSQAILTNKDGYILKPIQAGPRGEREIQFYRTITEATDSSLKQFQPFIPSFYGSCTKKDGQFMMIENATMRMTRPCIMDIKIGAKTYGPDASAEKAAKQDASYAGTKKPFGFSVLGMSVYHGAKKDEFKVLNKEYGKSLNKDNIEDFVNVFFDKANESEMTQALLSVFLGRLKAIQEMYSNQRVFHIFGSSILFVYDASILLESAASSEAIDSSVVVKMIDFAHVHPANKQPDQNYNFGLANLIKTLEGTPSA